MSPDPLLSRRLSASQTFLVGLNGRIPDPDSAFDELFNLMDAQVRLTYGSSRGLDQALNKIHGDWYEYLLAVSAHNVHVRTNSSFIAIELPNKTIYDCENLYVHRYSDLIVDLRAKVEESADVVLISSNPDFVILRMARSTTLPALNAIEVLDASIIEMLRGRYLHFDHSCRFSDIAGYLGAKLTLRPDRRLQLAHEGSLMKALYVHLQTRDWKLTPAGIRYYAATTKAGPADLRGLKTVATHSITTVTTEPQRAVDAVWVINTLREADAMFKQIYELSALSAIKRAAILKAGLASVHGEIEEWTEHVLED